MNNSGAITLTGLVSSGNNVSLTAGGAITEDITDGNNGAISGVTLTTTSVGGQTLEGANTVTNFNATNTTSGDINLVNTASSLAVTGISQTGTGSVILNNTGAISITGALSSANNVNLTATGAISEDITNGNNGAISAVTLTTTSVGGQTLEGANTVTNFNATNSTSGDINLVNSAATLTVTGISQTGTGSVYLE